jgi:hypothetical protein
MHEHLAAFEALIARMTGGQYVPVKLPHLETIAEKPAPKKRIRATA